MGLGVLFAAAAMVVTSAASVTGRAPARVHFAERQTMAVLVFVPPHSPGPDPLDVVRALGERLEPHTRFRVEGVEGKILPDCGGKLACVADKLRLERPRFALVISALAKKRGTRLSTTLLDVDAAIEEWDAASKSAPDWEEGVEAAVNERAVLAGTRFIELDDPGDLGSGLDRWVAETLSPALASRGEWDPFGEIEVLGPDGASVEIDGRAAGKIAAGILAIDGVRPGRRALRIDLPDYLPFEAAADVVRSERTEVRALLVRRPAEGSAGFRRAVVWSGAALAAAGVVVSAVALARHDGDVSIYCFSVSESACQRSRQFETLGYSSGVAPTFRDRLNPGGVLAIPLGYSAILTGATWSLGTVLAGDDADPPWLELGLGLAVGLITYGLSALFNGRTAF